MGLKYTDNETASGDQKLSSNIRTTIYDMEANLSTCNSESKVFPINGFSHMSKKAILFHSKMLTQGESTT